MGKHKWGEWLNAIDRGHVWEPLPKFYNAELEAYLSTDTLEVNIPPASTQSLSEMHPLLRIQARIKGAIQLRQSQTPEGAESNYNDMLTKLNKKLDKDGFSFPGKKADVEKLKKELKAMILHNLGILFLTYGNMSQAEKYFAESYALGNKSLKTRFCLAHLKYMKPKYKEANKLFSEILVDQAFEDLDFLLKFDIYHRAADALRGTLKSKPTRTAYDEIIKYYGQAISIAEDQLGLPGEIFSTTLSLLRFNRGLAYQDTGQHDQAIQEFSSLLKTATADAGLCDRVLFHRLKSYIFEMRYSEAATDLTTLESKIKDNSNGAPQFPNLVAPAIANIRQALKTEIAAVQASKEKIRSRKRGSILATSFDESLLRSSCGNELSRQANELSSGDSTSKMMNGMKGTSSKAGPETPVAALRAMQLHQQQYSQSCDSGLAFNKPMEPTSHRPDTSGFYEMPPPPDGELVSGYYDAPTSSDASGSGDEDPHYEQLENWKSPQDGSGNDPAPSVAAQSSRLDRNVHAPWCTVERSLESASSSPIPSASPSTGQIPTPGGGF